MDTNSVLSDLVERLGLAGGDTTDIEVKSAAGGYPSTVLESLGALANTPGGGILVFGLDEAAGFRPSGIYDAQLLKQRLGHEARSFHPAIQVSISDAELDSRGVVIAVVAECDPAFKPCTHVSGRAWARSYDGDYLLSDLEKQGFLNIRTAPHHDISAVPDTTVADLDPDAVDDWRAIVRRDDLRGLGRFNEDAMLRHGGVITSGGELTLAGLLMLGHYPQQYYPRFVVQVARLGPDGAARNTRSIAGTIPTMLVATMEWVSDNIDYTAWPGRDGNMRDVPSWPLPVIRELVANALVHRDLAAWSEGIAVNLRLTRDKLVISNPGGLYGVTVDRLGRERISHSRNANLVHLGVNVRTDGEIRVIESLASGLIRVNKQLDDAGLPRPLFSDTGIQFTAILRNPAAIQLPHALETGTGAKAGASADEVTAHRLKGQQGAVYQALMRAGTASVAALATETQVAPPSVRRALTQLREKKLATILTGGKGKHTTYAPTSVAAASPTEPLRRDP